MTDCTHPRSRGANGARGRRILTDEQIDRMAEMRERGLSYGQIALRFAGEGVAISPKTIRWQCLRVGAHAPIRHPNAGRAISVRGRPFTAEEDAKLMDLERRGLRRSDMARELGRPHNSITGRLYVLAREEAQAA